MNVKNAIIATVCGAAAIAAGNITSFLILNKIYASSEEKIEEINEFINK